MSICMVDCDVRDVARVSATDSAMSTRNASSAAKRLKPSQWNWRLETAMKRRTGASVISAPSQSEQILANAGERPLLACPTLAYVRPSMVFRAATTPTKANLPTVRRLFHHLHMPDRTRLRPQA